MSMGGKKEESDFIPSEDNMEWWCQWKMNIKDVREKSVEELESELQKLKKESFNLRFQKAGGQLENTARVRFVRRSIARILTVINSKVEKV